MNRYREMKIKTIADAYDIRYDEEDDIEELEKKVYEKGREKVDLIFIAESPPEYSKIENYFYYVEDGASVNGITSNLIKRLEENVYKNGKNDDGNEDKIYRIKKFLNKGYWLEDIFPKPMDCIKEKEAKNRVGELKHLIEKLDPDKIVMFLPKKIFKHKSMEIFCNEIGIEYQYDNDEFNLIKMQEKLLSKLLDDTIASKLAPFPGQGVPKVWKEKGYVSFKRWVEDDETKENVKFLTITEEDLKTMKG